MRRSLSLLVPLLLASTLLGCPLLKKKKADPVDDDPAAAADAATVSVSGTGAKNEADILRYANEEALDEPAVIAKDGTKVRNFPGNGPEVATLSHGTVVLKMAKYFSTGVLVMFDDPETDDGTKLMGWVTPTSFDVAAPKPVWTPPKIVDAGSKKTVVVVDAGGGKAVTTVDAGSTAPKDAGGGAAVVVKDAGGGGGGAIPQPGPGVVAVPPIDGRCPSGWMVHQSMCRRICSADGDCPRGVKCKAGSGKKICTAD